MITLKFGGTSMANARRILASADIIINRAKEDRLAVIVSAVAGVSNALQAAIDACTGGISGTNYVTDLRNTHNESVLNFSQSSLALMPKRRWRDLSQTSKNSKSSLPDVFPSANVLILFIAVSWVWANYFQLL